MLFQKVRQRRVRKHFQLRQTVSSLDRSITKRRSFVLCPENHSLNLVCHRSFHITWPPETNRLTPVRNEASSLSKWATAAATSVGLASRFSGVRLASSLKTRSL